MYAVVDLETTGGQPPRDRITEIAIVLHDGERITDRFHTLVNPERPIPLAVQRLTGITDAMVAEAPRFPEVARQIVELTEGRIFVAHNAQFDYGFLKAAFGELGYSYQRKSVCTVRLARQYLPGHESYSLGKLCRSLGIEVQGRHRALGDATATSELLTRILANSRPEGLLEQLEQEAHRLPLPPKLSPAVVDKLPVATGVYYFHDEQGKVLYVGKSINIRQRVHDHLRIDYRRKREAAFKSQIADISWTATGTELVALLHEAAEIGRYQPPFNRALKHRTDRFGLYPITDREGYRRIVLRPHQPGTRQRGNPLMLFRSAKAARRYLDWFAAQHGLCKKLLAAEAGVGPCFDFQLHRCAGACVHEEPPGLHNERFENAWHGHRTWVPSLLVVGAGRTPEERSVVWLDEHRYRGYGYVPADLALGSTTDLEAYIAPAEDTQYARALIRGYVQQGCDERVIVLSPAGVPA